MHQDHYIKEVRRIIEESDVPMDPEEVQKHFDVHVAVQVRDAILHLVAKNIIMLDVNWRLQRKWVKRKHAAGTDRQRTV